MAAPGSDRRQGMAEEQTLTSAAPIYGGRYRIEEELGHGGMGRVIRARDLKLGRDVALKVLAPGKHDEQHRRRFEQEARAAGALNHPNILDVHDVGEHEGDPYIVTELLQGETLRAALSRGPLPPAEALELAAQLAGALAAAHARGIVHRDLKPENLFLTDEGRLKVLDFGIAKLLEGSAAEGLQTATGALIGTPAYMSPEQIAGGAADARSDVFAIGIVLHEMLSGRPPFGRGSTLETAYAIVHAPPPPLPASTPEVLARAVRRCLEKEPEARYADAGALLADLRAGRPTGEAPAPARTQERPRSPPARRALLAAALAATAAALFWYAGSRSRGARRPPATASIAVLPFVDMSPAHDQEYFSDGLAEEILNSLAQIEALHVAGRTSSFSFKGKNEDLRSVGQKLGVAHVLEGSVRKQGDRVRITTQLVSVADGFHLWSRTFDRTLTDVFAVQGEIAAAVADVLEIKLLARQPSGGAASAEAYNEFLLGRQFQNRGSRDGSLRAAEAFRKAVRLAPGYAPAWASLAFARYGWAYYFAETPADFQSAQDEGFAAAEKAIALDPAYAGGYSARGFLRSAYRYDWAGAQADFERALALSPGNTAALQGSAAVLAHRGRLQEAIAAQRRLSLLDPLSARVFSILGSFYTSSGEYELSQKAFARALEIAPDLAEAPFGLGTNALLQHDARAALLAFGKTSLEYLRLTGVALAQEDLGHAAEAGEALQALIGRFPGVAAYQIAEVYAWRGDRERAFHWLGRAFEQHDPGVTYLKFDPLLRGLRGDPRYAGLLAKMNLPSP